MDLPDEGALPAAPAWNPLAAELLGSGSVLLELWDRVLPEEQRAMLTESLGAGDERAARRVAAFLAGVSRLGEANPARMDSFGLGDHPSPALADARERWRTEAGRAGLPLPSAGDRPYRARPEHLTAAVLPRLTGCDCPEFTDGERCFDRAHQGLFDVALALNTVRGERLHRDEVAKAHRAALGAGWGAVRASLVGAVAEHVGLRTERLAGLTGAAEPDGLAGFHRLVARCNRLAAGGPAPDFARPSDPGERLRERARRRAGEAVGRLIQGAR
ncbi:hypothetical protein [Streptomyces sp. NPDC001985]|uniref:HD domain-containing protein n=1 Tax=Streptomyces sp. NPDC001985 TaxID=3154406 RepID=UPI00331C42EA